MLGRAFGFGQTPLICAQFFREHTRMHTSRTACVEAGRVSSATRKLVAVELARNLHHAGQDRAGIVPRKQYTFSSFSEAPSTSCIPEPGPVSGCPAGHLSGGRGAGPKSLRSESFAAPRDCMSLLKRVLRSAAPQVESEIELSRDFLLLAGRPFRSIVNH